MELDDQRAAEFAESIAHKAERETIDRELYFKELFRLQGELVKLQDWVVDQKLKVVVIFEGRDAAGKGGVIKRITQRLNPRVCRVAALPAPTERERTQWYFQRYVAHLPAGGEIVLFDRSWYNRAGVERVMGFCTERGVRGVPAHGAGVRAHAGALRHHPDQVLVLDHRRRAALPLHDAHPRSAEAVEAQPDGYGIAAALGGLHQGQGGDARAHAHSRRRRWWVVEAVDKKRARLNCISHFLSPIPYQEVVRDADRAARARAQSRLHPRPHSGANVRAGVYFLTA